jgi:aldehyde dehydrogenase (NAD+)
MPLHDLATVSMGSSPSTNGGSQPAAERRLLIDGQLVTTSRVFASFNPATGDVLGHAPDAGVGEAQQAIAAARRAFDTTTWSTDAAFRVRCLERFPAVSAAGSA